MSEHVAQSPIRKAPLLGEGPHAALINKQSTRFIEDAEVKKGASDQRSLVQKPSGRAPGGYQPWPATRHNNVMPWKLAYLESGGGSKVPLDIYVSYLCKNGVLDLVQDRVVDPLDRTAT